MILRALLVTVLTAVLSTSMPSARAQAPTPAPSGRNSSSCSIHSYCGDCNVTCPEGQAAICKLARASDPTRNCFGDEYRPHCYCKYFSRRADHSWGFVE
jgi:hypothetical protein